MEEKTLFKLARAITDTGTDTVPLDGGTVTYRITSLERKLINGKVISTATPFCSLGSASVSWAIWGGAIVGDGYLDVKIIYPKNDTGSSRSTTLTFDQSRSNNQINLTVTQIGVTYKGYLKLVSNQTLGGNKDDAANIIVMSYLKGSDGSKKPEAPNIGSAPNWCLVSLNQSVIEDYYVLSLIAASSNQTGANRSGHIFLTCGDANLSIPITQTTAKKIVSIVIDIYKSPTSSTSANCDIKSDQPVDSNITFKLRIQYGVSPGDVREYNYTLIKGNTISRNSFDIQKEADPRLLDYSYSPREDSKYIYTLLKHTPITYIV